MPPGWKLTGQYEQGDNGTRHFQGMLTTPQVRFSAVKKVYPRAHIEIARNKKALSQYVDKEETRVASFGGNDSPTIFQYQDMIADKWDWDTWATEYNIEVIVKDYNADYGKAAMAYVDKMCGYEIANGAKGLEFISINPIWRSSWMKFWSSILERRKNERVKLTEQNTNDIV